ncbi:hypothetical protein [Stygiolobus caldivivus]|uniref:Uncharacterized protein n=1 Tax=Stygiolobus caldivivus TaxID=2824673 RepID=A0A8D5U5V4_9CREN|nr:hypothetical protein [Stygiolobus caldivivus]BCU69635.1 hypothetical protein KN1_09320 [Stygiolobus caldivivus]
MPIVISDHMDPDVDFYVPPGNDSAQAFEEAFLVSKIYGVAHIIVRGRLYIYASSSLPITLDPSLHFIIEGDGLGEIVYVNPNNLSNPPPAFTTGYLTSLAEIQSATPNNAVVQVPIMQISTFGWVVAFKNMRLVNITSQQWFMVSGQQNSNITITSFYFDGVQFFSNVELLYTGTVIVMNCYSNGSQLSFGTMSRDIVVMASRFENSSLTTVSPHGWSFVGCVFVGLAQVSISGNNGSIIGCVFDGATLNGQNSENVKVVASQFQNVSFSGISGNVTFTLGTGYSVVANAFYGYSVILSLGQGSWAVVGFNTFKNSANLVVLAQDGSTVENVSIIGNEFSTLPTHNSFIFVSGWSSQGTPQLTGVINVLYIAFNSFTNSAGPPYIVYGYEVTQGMRIHGIAYINVAISVVSAFISFNYFANNGGLKSNSSDKVIGYISLQQLNNNVQLIKNLILTFNVNEGNNAYLPEGQTYNAQFNVGI